MATPAVLAKMLKAKVSLHYTGQLKVRFMIQQWQFRKSHKDQHYAAAVFRYLLQYAVKLRDICTLVCLDNKHHLKVGEPGFQLQPLKEEGGFCGGWKLFRSWRP